MAKTQLTYYINLTDADQVAAYQAQYPNGVTRGPLPAATEFSAPFQAEGTPFSAPSTRTGWLPPGAAGKFPMDRTFFTINDSWWGHLFGSSREYVWVGQFVYSPPVDVAPSASLPTPGPLREVAWSEGFEFGGVSTGIGPEGAAAGTSTLFSRDASRTPDGMGLAIRDDAGTEFRHAWNRYGATATPRGWERFYIRPRVFGGGDQVFWRSRQGSNVSLTNSGLALVMNSSGGIVVRHVSNGGAIFGTAVMTAPEVPLNEWTLIDIVMENTAGAISVALYYNHNLVASVTNQSHTMGAAARNLDSSTIGRGTIGFTATGLELDVDDWIGFILPASTVAGANELWNGTTNLGPDWTHGHHVAAVEPYVFDATHGTWTGNVRGLAQRLVALAQDVLTSSTSAALCAVNTKLPLKAGEDGVLGIQALNVNIHWRRATAGDGELGFAFKAVGQSLVTTMTAITGSATNVDDSVMYRPTGLTAPLQVESFMLRFTHGANTNAYTLSRLAGTALLVGTFGAEDRFPVAGVDVDDIAVSGPRGTHNAPYPRVPWNRTEVPPDSPVWVKSGSYTGNALGQDVIAKIPAHFWWVRQIGVAGGGVRWFSSMVGSHWAIQGEVRALAVASAVEDPEFVSSGGATDPESRSLLRVAGANNAENANTTVYQYLAIGDPGSRFMLNGAFAHSTNVAEAPNSLIDPDFTPQAAFFMLENQDDVAQAMFYKGLGHAAPNGSRLDSTQGTTVARFGAGTLNSLVTLHSTAHLQVAYSAFRRQDGADYTAFGQTEPIPFQMFSYVGDGAASRTLALPRTTGVRPLWALIVPLNGAAYVRDPAHTTNTSSTAEQPNSTVTTGLTGGGIDQISVGSTLNANGIVHEVFVVMGSATAGNGGWSADADIFIDPIPAPGGQWPSGFTQEELDELENPTDGGAVDSFDDGPDLADDLADALCVPFTVRACNLALARLGISDLITSAADLLTPTSREHTLLAEFYEHTLRFVLRDYPWAHATRYASLTRIAGEISDPVNADWVYSFRAPTGCLMVRRVIREGVGRRHDPAPPAFRMAEDAIGPLVYVTDDGVQFDSTDEPFIEIEYTVRPACGAKAGGDQKFVSAFAYRLGLELGPPLARDEKVVARMAAGYLWEKATASTTVGNEQQQQPPGDPDWLLGR